MKVTNDFMLSDIDLDTFDYPKVKVEAWSAMFREDDHLGHFAIVTDKDDNGKSIELMRVPIDKYDDQRAIRRDLEEEAEEWNSDLLGNWNRELIRAFTHLSEYEKREIDALEEHKANLEKYQRILKRLEATK